MSSESIAMHSNSIPLHSVHSLMQHAATAIATSNNNNFYSQPSASSSATTTSASSNPRPVKRSRKAINCEPCRASKLKCDRGKPCSGCVLRGTVSACYPDSNSSAAGPDDSNDGGADEYIPNPRVDPRAELTRIRNSLLVLEQAINRSTNVAGDVHSSRRAGGDKNFLHARMPEDPPPKPGEGGVFVGATSIASTLLSLGLRQDRSDDDSSDFDGGVGGLDDASSTFPYGLPCDPSPSRTGSNAPFQSTQPSPAHIDDLLQALPDPSEIDSLIDNYFTNSTWLHRHIHEATFRASWAKFKASGDEAGHGSAGGGGGGNTGWAILLATVFGILAISLQYLVPTHPIFQQLHPDPVQGASSPGGPPSSSTSTASSSRSPDNLSSGGGPTAQQQTQSQVQVSLGAHYFSLAELAYKRHLVETKALSMSLVEYLLIKVHYLNIRKEDCEQIWEVRGELVSLGTAMGLHRDPGKWKMAKSEVERRRWAWWNILQTDRWQAFLFGRPIGIGNHHFDTHYPMDEPGTTTSSDGTTTASSPTTNITVASNPLLAYLVSFRLVHIMGDIMDDATSIRPVSHDRIMQHDRALEHLLRTLPPDMDVDDVFIARSLAPNRSVESKRLAAQTIVNRSALHHVRFTLHRPFTTPNSTGTVPASARQMSLDIATTAASSLIQLVTQSAPDYCKTNSLGIPGHLSWGSFHAFAAAMFFTFQLIWNADSGSAENMPGVGIFRENVRRVQRVLEGVRGQVTLAGKAWSVLEALKPLWEEPGGNFSDVVMMDGGELDEKRKGEVWARARKLAFPCHDSPLYPQRGGLARAGSLSSESPPPFAHQGTSMSRRGSEASPAGSASSAGGQMLHAPSHQKMYNNSNDTYSHNNSNNHHHYNTHSNNMSPPHNNNNHHHHQTNNNNGHYSLSMQNHLSIPPPANVNPNGMMIGPPNSSSSSTLVNTTPTSYHPSQQQHHSPTTMAPSNYFDMGIGMGMGMSFAASEDALWSASLGLYGAATPLATAPPVTAGGPIGGGGGEWANMYKFGRD